MLKIKRQLASESQSEHRVCIDLAISYLDQLTGINTDDDDMNLMNTIQQHQTRDNRTPINLELVIDNGMKRSHEATQVIRAIDMLIEKDIQKMRVQIQQDNQDEGPGSVDIKYPSFEEIEKDTHQNYSSNEQTSEVGDLYIEQINQQHSSGHQSLGFKSQSLAVQKQESSQRNLLRERNNDDIMQAFMNDSAKQSFHHQENPPISPQVQHYSITEKELITPGFRSRVHAYPPQIQVSGQESEHSFYSNSSLPQAPMMSVSSKATVTQHFPDVFSLNIASQQAALQNDLRYQSIQTVPQTLAQQNPEHIIQAFYSVGTGSTISDPLKTPNAGGQDINPTMSDTISGFSNPFNNKRTQNRNTPLILYQGQTSSIGSLTKRSVPATSNLQTSQSTQQIKHKPQIINKTKKIERKTSPNSTKKIRPSPVREPNQRSPGIRSRERVQNESSITDQEAIRRMPIHLRAQYIVEQREAKLSKLREEKEWQKAEEEYQELMEMQRIQQERLDRVRSRSNDGGGRSTYLLPKKPPREWYNPNEQATFHPQINQKSSQIVQEKRVSEERSGEKPTRLMRPVEFLIYDPQRQKDFVERQKEGALVSQLLGHLLQEKYQHPFKPQIDQQRDFNLSHFSAANVSIEQIK